MAQAQASDRTSEPTASSTKNNSGVGFFVGSSATVLTNRGPGAHKHGVVGSTPVSNAVVDYADPAESTGTFKNDSTRLVAQRVASTLAGVSNTAILSGGHGDVHDMRSIARQEKVRSTRLATAIRAGNWNPTSGSFSSITTAADDFYSITAEGTQATSSDTAATPTRAEPGQLVFAPVRSVSDFKDYAAKTG